MSNSPVDPTGAAPKDLEGALRQLQFSSHDLDGFRRLGIPVALLLEAGIRRVSNSEARSMYGIVAAEALDLEGIVFPYFSPETGFRTTARLRRDNPEIENGKPKNKYISAWGDHRHLYTPPRMLEKLSLPQTGVVLVEAEKSVLALIAWADRMQENLVPIGLGGCWGWRGRIGITVNSRGEREPVNGPLSDLRFCDGHRVYVLFDANAATNVEVRRARMNLVVELRTRECEVFECCLPAVDGVNGPDDYIAVCGDEAMAEVFKNSYAATAQIADCSDDALALQFSEIHNGDLLYTAQWGQWAHWNGRYWERDNTLRVNNLVRSLCRNAAADAKKPAMARRVASAQTVSAVERLAQSDPRHAATIDQWDREPWLLNTPGGVVDLETSKLRLARQKDFMTKVTGAAPGGGCPLWKSFLSRVTDGDSELQGFLQRMCGYALTGVTKEQVFFFLYGTGGNGKSVFLTTIAQVMGDYAKPAPIETFVVSTGERHPTDLAGLQGARLVTATETEAGRRWAESRLKSLTGGEPVCARYMRQDFFAYLPQFKLIFAGNHKPGLRSLDNAMRRRFHLNPFAVTIPDAEMDRWLGEKLKLEWGGILQWMIEGCLEWQQGKLNPPGIVTAATADFFADEDSVGQWIADSCHLGKESWSSIATIHKDYAAWCSTNGENVESAKWLSQNLSSRGFKSNRRNRQRGFPGIAMRHS